MDANSFVAVPLYIAYKMLSNTDYMLCHSIIWIKYENVFP